MESVLVVYAYALDHLAFLQAHFYVRKDNGSVLLFHERFDANRISETDLDYLFKLDLTSIKASCSCYSELLPDGIIVS